MVGGSISLDKKRENFYPVPQRDITSDAWWVVVMPPLYLGRVYLSCSSLSALSMFMRCPTRVTPRSIRSSFCSEGRCAPSISLSRNASLCSPRFRLSSQSATSCLLHSSMGLEAKGLPDAATACISVSGDGERELPLPPQDELRL